MCGKQDIPQLITSIIGLTGTLFIVFTLNLNVFWLCLIILLLVIIVYGITGKRTLSYNKQFNDELERRVDVIAENQPASLKDHIRRLMKWNIKLSDLETFNFSIIWLAMIFALVFAIILAIEGGVVKYGTLFSIIMYFFQFMEDVITLPLFYQQWLRLVEIFDRLRAL